MKTTRKSLLLSGIGCAIAFAFLTFFGAPFMPDACTSQGYGYPFPIFMSRCECVTEGFPLTVSFSYLVYDLVFWSSVWLIFGFGLKRVGKPRNVAVAQP